MNLGRNMTPSRRVSVGRDSAGKGRAGKDDRDTQATRRTSRQGRTKSMKSETPPDIANSNESEHRHPEDSKMAEIKPDGPFRAVDAGVGSSKLARVDSSDKRVKFCETKVNDCGKQNGKDRNALHVVVLVSHILSPLISSMDFVTGNQLSLLLL